MSWQPMPGLARDIGVLRDLARHIGTSAASALSIK